MAIVYDRKAESVSEGGRIPTGLCGQISFRRLCESLEEVGEVRPNEKITHLEIGLSGLISYRIERKSTDG